jgi:hypothetical protein
MKHRISENNILRKLFREAYFAREKDGSAGPWRQQVMTRVRKIGPLMPVPGFWPTLERVVWRLAPVNAVLILLLLLFTVRLDPGFDYLGNSVAELDRPSFSEFLGLEES